MAGYTKLFSSLVTSTVWSTSKETKIVWITMLALADRNGMVEASVPGLAVVARVSTDECRESLKTLMAPDPDSRTKDFEGRRIEEREDGWKILNHGKYRDKMRSAERTEYLRDKQREHRKKKLLTDVDVNSVNQYQPIAEASASPDTEEEKATSLASGSNRELDWRIEQTWKAHLDQRRIFYEHFDKRVPPEPALTNEIRSAIRDAIKTHDRDYRSPERREEWLNTSKARAAGMGIFHDPWCSGRDEGSKKRFLEPWRPWKRQKGKGDPVERFAQIFHDHVTSRQSAP